MSERVKFSDNCTVEVHSFGDEDALCEHPNESVADVIPSHDNCRHNGTEVCKRYLKIKRTYERRTGQQMQKQYCAFWSYKPVGLWSK